MAIAAGVAHCLALKTDGTVVAWGSYNWGATTVPPALANVVAVAAGYGSSFALKADGTIVAWGNNDDGERNVPSSATNAVAISAGEYSVVAILGSLPPRILGQPASQLANTGETISFRVAASGTLPLSYQWQFNGTNIAWGTDPVLTITNVQTSDVGLYDVIVSNAGGSVTSAVATLSIRVLNLQMIACFTVEGPVGANVRLDWSLDLSDWNTLTNFALPTSPFRYLDWDSVGLPRRFYRAVFLP